jgi:hypothetical protein
MFSSAAAVTGGSVISASAVCPSTFHKQLTLAVQETGGSSTLKCTKSVNFHNIFSKDDESKANLQRELKNKQKTRFVWDPRETTTNSNGGGTISAYGDISDQSC